MRLMLILVPVISFTMNFWSGSWQVCRTCSLTPEEVLVYFVDQNLMVQDPSGPFYLIHAVLCLDEVWKDTQPLHFECSVLTIVLRFLRLIIVSVPLRPSFFSTKVWDIKLFLDGAVSTIATLTISSWTFCEIFSRSSMEHFISGTDFACHGVWVNSIFTLIWPARPINFEQSVPNYSNTGAAFQSFWCYWWTNPAGLSTLPSDVSVCPPVSIRG